MQRLRALNWVLPVLLIIAIGIVLWLSPEERTLGARIKIVYIHVAFVWTGLFGMLLTAILSLGVFWRPWARRLGRFLLILNLASVLCFGIGFALSMLAAQINWGGIPWSEPRAIASLRILSVAAIVQVIVFLFADLRIRALSYIGLLAFAVWANMDMQNAIHPSNAIFSSESNSFAIAVLTLMALVVMLVLWFMNLSYRQLQKA